MFKRFLVFVLAGFTIFNFCGCALMMTEVVESEEVTQDLNASSSRVLEAVKGALTSLNIKFNEPVIEGRTISVRGQYSDGRTAHITISGVSANQSRVEIRVGTSEAGKKDAQKILDAVRQNLK